MSFRRLLHQTATIRNTPPTTADTEGNWSPGTQAVAVEPCRFELYGTEGSATARSGETFGQGADQVVSVGRLFLLPTSVITARATVEIDGDHYEVDGQPVPMHTPRGVHHLEVRVRLVDR